MAVIYTCLADGVRYEIRAHGRSIRLYTNKVLHTQYHPEHRVSGGVWDLLAMPALALDKVKNVLLLGVGGGAAIHILRDWCPGVEVIGVELNPVHLRLARRFFDLKGSGITLHEGDAREFVLNHGKNRFDLVIEDLFGGNHGQPDRSFDADRAWCNALGRLVSSDGALVMNTLGRKQLRTSAFVTDQAVGKQWASHLCLTLPAYENHVGAFFRRPVSPMDLRRAVRSDPERLLLERKEQLRYRINTLG